MSGLTLPTSVLALAVVVIVARVVSGHLKKREFHHMVRRHSIAMRLNDVHAGDLAAQGELAREIVAESECSKRERRRLHAAAVEALQENWLDLSEEKANAFVSGEPLLPE